MLFEQQEELSAVHQSEHNNPDFDYLPHTIDHSCLICFPRPQLIPVNFLNFWNWIENYYNGVEFTIYTVSSLSIYSFAFRNDPSNNKSAQVINLAIKLFLSITYSVNPTSFPTLLHEFLNYTYYTEYFTLPVTPELIEVFQTLTPDHNTLSFTASQVPVTPTLTVEEALLSELPFYPESDSDEESVTTVVSSTHSIHSTHSNSPIPNMTAITNDEMAVLLGQVFGNTGGTPGNPRNIGDDLLTALTNNQTAITNLTTANQNCPSGKIIEVPLFHGNDDEDPVEWLNYFEEAHTANGWSDARKLALAVGHLRDTAREWYRQNAATITQYVDNTTIAQSFKHQFPLYFATADKQRQWTHELQNIKQKDGESVELYSTRFKKLLRRATSGAALDARYQVNYFLNGLSPAYVSQVVISNPATLDDAITRAKLVETGSKLALQNMEMLPQSTLTPVTISSFPNATTSVTPPVNTVIPTPDAALEELTKQMKELSLNYANLYSAFRNGNGNNATTNRNNRVAFNNNNRNNNRANFSSNQTNNVSNVQCYNCGTLGHYARNCPAKQRGQRRNNANTNNYRAANLMDYDGDNDYYTEDEFDEDEEYLESETFLNTRSGPYPSAPVSKNRRGRRPRSESNIEETLRMPTPEVQPEMDPVPIPSAYNSVASPVTPKKIRKKMMPAPIEALDEFNVASYLQNLPCGLTIGQAAHNIPKYRSGMVRALRRTREKEANYAEQHSDEDEQTTAAKCEVFINREPIIAVVDSGAATSIITDTLLNNLGYNIARSSKLIIVTANGHRVRALGAVDNLPIQLNNTIIASTVNVISSKDNVLILGNDWLKKVQAVINYNEQMVTIQHRGRVIKIPLTFTMNKKYTVSAINDESSEEEYETEDDLQESRIYFSDVSSEYTYSSEDEDLEFNPWRNHNTTEEKLTSKPILEEESEDEFLEENPAVYLAEAATTPQETSSDLHLGPLTYEQQNNFNRLLESYADICAQGQMGIGCTNVIKHRIITGDAPPVAQPAYQASPKKLDFIKREVADLLQKGMIRKSASPYASPVVVVGKKGGDMRLCVDYRKLNAITKPNMYPLPRIDNILDSFNGSDWFTTLDLASGYWQVAMDEADVEKTAFITPFGLYEFLRMPFGLAYAPGTFQRLMNHVLHDYLQKFVQVYLDDVIIHTKGSLEQHLDHIKQVFETLRRANLMIKLKKCYFCMPTIHFLGHVIGRDGIKPDADKVEKIKNFPIPKDRSQLRSAMGLFSYYRRFIRDFSKIASPLNKLLKKEEPFSWTEKQQRAFDYLKERLITAPILMYPDFTKPFILYTDASGTGLGAVLSQMDKEGKERVVAYASRTLNEAEKKYTITEQECLAVIWAVRKFKYYLESEPFTIVTDHVALKWLKTSKIPDGRRARWIMDLQQFTFEIKHRSGKSNSNADGLSRMYEEENHYAECFFMDMQYEDTEDLYSEYSSSQDAWGDEKSWYSNADSERWYQPTHNKEYNNPPDQLYYTTAYTYSQEELALLHGSYMREKQVIANQPINSGGSRCDFSCDIENHHIHNYCKACKRNLPFGVKIHNCTVGIGIGKFHFDMNPDFLVNQPWWKEPEEVTVENRARYAQHYQKEKKNYPSTCQYGQRTFGKFVNLGQY